MFRRFIIAAATLPILLSCGVMEKHFEKKDFTDYFDPSAKLSRDDYTKTLDPVNSDKSDTNAETKAPPVPKVSRILVTPKPPKRIQEQNVSIAVTEDVPLKDVFLELGRLANIDIEMDPNITGGIIFRAKDKPLEDVVKRICEMTGLVYKFEDNTLKINRDMPYLKNYTVDFLNIERSSDGDISISTNVLSAGEGGSKDAVNSGSKASIKAKSDTDLWKNFSEALTQILKATAPEKSSSGGSGAGAASAAGAPGGATAGASSSSSGNVPDSFFTVNKEGGLLTLFATKHQHEKIAEFIDSLNRKVSQQVLIEAKVVEVTLDDKYSSGIDWGSISLSRGLNFGFDIVPSASGSALALTAKNRKNGSLEAAVNLTEQFGTTRTLSSPRITALNNQQAVLTYAQNKVYFQIKVDRETNTSTSTSQQLYTVDSTVKTVPIGLIITVLPSVNPDTDEVTMNVRPTLSRMVDQVADPAVAYLASQSSGTLPADLQNLIPVVEVREMDTMMKIKSGDIMVIGGMMEEKNNNTDNGVPFLSDVPWVGNAFKNVNRENQVVEMVIFMKATIIPTSGKVTKQDINTYRKFTNDPHPLDF